MNGREMMEKTGRNRTRKKIKVLLSITLASVLITVLTIVVSVFVCRYYKSMDKTMVEFENEEIRPVLSDDVYTKEQVNALMDATIMEAQTDAQEKLLSDLKLRFEEGDGTMMILRDLFPDELVVPDNNRYFFIPINENLSKNGFTEESFKMDESGILRYVQDSGAPVENGIDVSKFQEGINWEEVAGAGIDYAIIRLGIRGYSEGAIMEDECFQTNMEGALANGIKTGVYFFTQATSNEEALEEAQFVIEKLQGYSLTYPVYLDIEEIQSENCRTKNLTAQERTDYAITFLEAIKAAGYMPGLYGNLKSYVLMLDLSRLEEYDKWFAAYSLPFYYPYSIHMYQYTDKGNVAGIKGKVDRNISFKKYGETQ